MNVYEINSHTIAAKNADEALSCYIEDTCWPENLFFGELIEGEEDSCEVKIKRLSEKEKSRVYITCCFDGCKECEDRNEPVLYSPNELIEKNKEFPCIICREE